MAADPFIEQALAAWPEWPIERAIFGTDDAAAITAALDDLCRAQLGGPLASCFHHSSTVGVVFGLRLEDGRGVAVKCHHPDWESRERLVAVRGAHAVLADAGYPTPRPLIGPVALGLGWATVDEWRAPSAGARGDPRDPAVRARMAGALCDQIRICRTIDAQPFESDRLFGDGAWLPPYRRLFDELPLDDANSWIDESARAADAILGREAAGDTVVGHSDWRADQVVVVDGRLDVVYDWESLAARGEAELIGTAAISHQLTLRSAAPAIDRARAFIVDYEAARASAFTVSARVQAAAGALLLVAFIARGAHRRGSRETLAHLRCAPEFWLDL